MKPYLSLFLLGIAGCSYASGEASTSSNQASAVPLTPLRFQQALFDLEGEPAPGFPSLGSLDLEPDGTYTCFVMNGITVDGCASFEGAGQSRGRWVLSEGALAFLPEDEPADLALSLQGATGHLRGDELILRTDGGERRLVTDAEQERASAAYWDGRSR